MNKEQKRDFLKAALSGNFTEVERILKANENHFFIEMQPGLYCTNQHPCECVSPKDCIYLKDESELRKIYSNAVFIGVSDVTPEIIQRFAEFDTSAPQAKSPLLLRNTVINLEKHINHD